MGVLFSENCEEKFYQCYTLNIYFIYFSLILLSHSLERFKIDICTGHLIYNEIYSSFFLDDRLAPGMACFISGLCPGDFRP